MGTRYRVDRCEGTSPPVGMNSIRYLGDSAKHARETLWELEPGFDAWDQPDPRFGVLLSMWSGREYVMVSRKPPPQD